MMRLGTRATRIFSKDVAANILGWGEPEQARKCTYKLMFKLFMTIFTE
jgi:hypothetical protein